MFNDDLEPRKAMTVTLPRNLENMSVAELEEYIEELNAEIGRVEADIEQKNASKEAADSVFKS